MKIKPNLTHAILIVKLKLKISCLVAIKFEKFTNPLELNVVAKTFKIKYDFSRIYILRERGQKKFNRMLVV